MADTQIFLDLVSGVGGQMTSEGAYGTQFAYLRVPEINDESHAFSLADRSLSIVIKGAGDWTKRLHQLAVTQATEALSASAGADVSKAVPVEQLTGITTDLVCEIDGVYGNASPPWRSFSHVLFVGGGVGVTPWLPAMEEHQELLRQHGSSAQTMKLCWIGRDHAELEGMGRYLPPDDTRVFLTRVKAPAASPAASEPSASLEESCEAGQSGQTDDDTTEQAFVGKSDTRPWLFAFVGVVSLCLTQSLYYYLRGENSVYVDYERGCGEWCFEGEPSQTQYFIVKLLAVACSYFAIAGATVFARWTSRRGAAPAGTCSF